MKTFILISLLVTLTACSSFPKHPGYTSNTYPESYRIYDESGDFAGHIDGSYRVYDRDGNFIGMIKK